MVEDRDRQALAATRRCLRPTSVDSWSDDALVEEFRRARQEAYGELASEVEQLLPPDERRPSCHAARALRRRQRSLDGFRQRLTAIEAIDFFGSAGRDRVVQLC